MINYQEFNFPFQAKETFNKKPFSLSFEQLSFLCLISDEFNLTNTELMTLEYIVTRQTKIISLNRFNQLDFFNECLGALMFLLDREEKDVIQIHEFIERIHLDKYVACSTRAKAYKKYRNLHDVYFGIELGPETYETFDKALKLRKVNI